MPYRPQPLDTIDVTIPPRLEGLVEKLAAWTPLHDFPANSTYTDGEFRGCRQA